MKKFVVFALLVFFVLPSFLQNVTYADAAPVFLGGVNIMPYNENSITLKEENLNIQFKNVGSYSSTTATVYAKFIFVNTGDKISLKTGFPFGLAKKKGFNTPNRVANVKVKIDGKAITPNLIRSETSKYDPWIYFNISFDKNETRTLEVTYDAIPVGGYFLYVLKTGALWKGPIGILNIDLKFPYRAVYPNVLNVKPSGYITKGSELLYHLVNFEPTSNIEVEFLPYSFYEKIKPLKDKAEKTNSANDWFNYALSLFPQNPLGTLQDFVRFYKTTAYSDYVSDVLDRAMSLQKEGGTEYIILKEIYDAHFSDSSVDKQFFNEGYDILSRETNDSGHIYLLNDALNLLKNDIKAPKSKLESRIIESILEYTIFGDLKGNDSVSAIEHFNTLLNIASKYGMENNAISPMFLYAMHEQRIQPKFITPPFNECFIPSVKIKNSTVFITYILPCAMKTVLRDFYSNSAVNYSLRAQTDKTPSYAYNISINLPSKNEKEFDDAKKYLIIDVKQNALRANEVKYGNSYKFINIYLSDILNNLSLKNGKIVANAPSIDCSSKIDNAFKKLDDEISIIETYKKKIKNENFDSFSNDILSYLSYNRDYFDYAKKNPKIVFENISDRPARASINKNLIIILLSAIIIALLMVIIILLKKGVRRA